MKIKLKRSYPKLENEQRKLDKNGVPITVFVYTVTGNKKETDQYREIMEAEGHTHKDEDGTLLWFTTNPVGRTGELRISPNGKVYADTTNLDLASAMIRQYGQLGRDIAKGILESHAPEAEPEPEPETDPNLDK